MRVLCSRSLRLWIVWRGLLSGWGPKRWWRRGRAAGWAAMASTGDAETMVGGQGKTAEVLVGAPRPTYCRAFTRARFAEALPEVTATLLREAKKGSVAHLKLLVQISGIDKGEIKPAGKKRRGKGLEQLLKEAWEASGTKGAEREPETFPDTSGGE